VDIHTYGWEPGSRIDIQKSVYVDRNDAKTMINELREIRDRLLGGE
jgi:hypothetical protein